MPAAKASTRIEETAAYPHNLVHHGQIGNGKPARPRALFQAELQAPLKRLRHWRRAASRHPTPNSQHSAIDSRPSKKPRGTRKERATLKKRKLLKRAERQGAINIQLEKNALPSFELSWSSRLTLCGTAIILLGFIHFVTSPSVYFTGRVIDPAGGPIAGAQVPWHLEMHLGLDTHHISHTDSQGYFHFGAKNLKGHKLHLGPIEAPGYQDITPEARRHFKCHYFSGPENESSSGGIPVFEVKREESLKEVIKTN